MKLEGPFVSPMQILFERPHLLPAAVAVAGVGALAVALASQYWGGLEPCVLCIHQRYAHGAAAAVALLALFFPAQSAAWRGLVALGALAFLAGAAIAFFHVGVEQHWWRGTAECHAPSFESGLSLEELREQMLNTRFVPCDEVPWALFGISMAGYNFLASLVLGLMVLWAVRMTAPSRRQAGGAA